MTLRRSDGWALPGNRWDLLADVEPGSPPSISVIVSHFEQPSQLARTLRALDRQRHPAELVEIIVVDDGSREPPQVPGHVHLIRQDDLGFRLAAARNRGAVAARNDVLVFLDADTAPEPDYLSRLSRLPALTWDAVTVGRRRHADLTPLDPAADVELEGPSHLLPDPAWLADAYGASGDLLRVDSRSYRYVIGAVIACTRRFFAETGGFDESFTRYGGEDWEWAYRAWLNGAVLAHVPGAVAWHDGPDSAGRGDSLAGKNDEAIRLAELIPVPSSRGRGLPSTRTDIAVTLPAGDLSAGQRFISLDSVLAAVPGAAVVEADGGVASEARAGTDGDAGTGERLDPARLDRARLDPARLDRVRLDPARLDRARLDPARLDPARLDRARLYLARLDRARLDPARLDRARLDRVRFDRVRLDVIVERAVSVESGSLDDALAAIDGDVFSEVVIRATDGEALIRVASRRARSRFDRWGGDARLPALDLTASGIQRLSEEPDVEAYLGGW